MAEPTPSAPVFPPLTRASVDAARTSAWHDTFEDLTAPATVIDVDALGERDAFIEWLDADSIFLPEGSEGPNAGPANPDAPVYRLPRLNAAIRDAVDKYGGAVFPKLNWTAPRDAAFILPQGNGPLHCQTPADVYLLIKSSDFVSHGMGPRAYEGTEDATPAGSAATGANAVPRIELVLKKFVEMNPAREVRCFVRGRKLIGISQRDLNYYDHLQSAAAHTQLIDTVREFWEDEIADNYDGGDDYVFDLYIDDTDRVSIIDFEPYRESTDPLLFTYPELQSIYEGAWGLPNGSSEPQANGVDDASSVSQANGLSTSVEPATAACPASSLSQLRVIDDPHHTSVTRNVPQFSGNMMPVEMLEMSQGRNLEDFREQWEAAVAAGMMDSGSESEDETGA